jgi:hypothetical protein
MHRMRSDTVMKRRGRLVGGHFRLLPDASGSPVDHEKAAPRSFTWLARARTSRGTRPPLASERHPRQTQRKFPCTAVTCTPWKKSRMGPQRARAPIVSRLAFFEDSGALRSSLTRRRDRHMVFGSAIVAFSSIDRRRREPSPRVELEAAVELRAVAHSELLHSHWLPIR